MKASEHAKVWREVENYFGNNDSSQMQMMTYPLYMLAKKIAEAYERAAARDPD